MNVLRIFRRPDYQSEVTQFIDQLKASKPSIETGQRLGRELLWDKSVDTSAWESYRAAQVAQQPYVYQTRES